ncbi:MAG: hypothetical protein H0V01_09075 [Bacteroidetes bacterium]|nr:hypothetical protein [Bacteroidota bacterium]HET6244643.1 hypothetical protein [Bacteroidia bacterium]
MNEEKNLNSENGNTTNEPKSETQEDRDRRYDEQRERDRMWNQGVKEREDQWKKEVREREHKREQEDRR